MWCTAPQQDRCVTVPSEESQWEQRQRQTGAAGKLVIYEKGESPGDDVMLRDGCGNKVVVSMVIAGGKAWKAGVSHGDVLVSIDGKKHFAGLPACQVRELLRAPAVLVFMGFVGKLQAEVRLKHKKKMECGVSSQLQFASEQTGTAAEVIDEVVFEPFVPVPSVSAPTKLSVGLSGCGDPFVTHL